MEAKPELKYIFQNVSDWLKFAEAKHAGLIVFNAGTIIGLLSSYSSIHSFVSKVPVCISLACFGISILLSLFSQVPVTSNRFFNQKEIGNVNLYFFGHLCHINDKTFISEFVKISPNFSATQLDNQLINQILVNARITQAKYTFYKFASYITAFAAGFLGLTTIMKILWHC